MFCPQCGSTQNDELKFCKSCGVNLDAVRQALAYGVKVFGVTVHFVDEGVDTGPVILQRATDLPDARDPQEVLERLHPIEHELLPEAVRLIARGAVKLDPTNPRRVVIER